ncbi:MAG: GNAT family N-acetyltransferase [Treponema sp.]
MLETLETERLILRPLCLSDYKAAFKWCGDVRVNKFMMYGLYASEDDVKKWLESPDDDETQITYGFLPKDGDEVIGCGGMTRQNDGGLWSVGYNLRFDDWNKGYATEALAKIIEYAREARRIKALEGTVAVENAASRRVLEKLGFRFCAHAEYSKLDGSASFKAKIYRIEY